MQHFSTSLGWAVGVTGLGMLAAAIWQERDHWRAAARQWLRVRAARPG
jgi:hypothetical protein